MNVDELSPDQRPVVIIGAARSGTNMLRDVLTKIPGVGTWPCDEINYIWRYGNARYPTDELLPKHATEKVKSFIQKKFKQMAQELNCRVLIEKTCANSLRVPFVNEILPHARFIFLIRDGRDVVASALRRWKSPLNVSYILQKAKYVPYLDVPFYAGRFLNHRLRKIFSTNNILPTWGPRYEGIDQHRKDLSLAEVASLQWKYSVSKSAEALEQIPQDRVLRIYYEEFVRNPSAILPAILNFITDGRNDRFKCPEAVFSQVHASSANIWAQTLCETELKKIMPIIEGELKCFGYPSTSSSMKRGCDNYLTDLSSHLENCDSLKKTV